MPKAIGRGVVCLVADIVERHEDTSVDNRQLEFAEIGYFKAMRSTLESLGYQVMHLRSPTELVAKAETLTDSAVISVWSGEGSRSRRSLVGSICEGAGIPYVGADAYTAIVCQDKQLSKSYAHRFGIKAPAGIVLEAGYPLPLTPPFEGPYVVKPLLEGGSIGIDQDALCSNWRLAQRQTQRLFSALGSPVLIEEFLEGEEISVCLLGNPKRDPVIGAVRLEIEGFNLAQGIWSSEIKKTPSVKPKQVPILGELDPAFIGQCRSLFESFEKIDYMRIDGRMTADGFKLIELSPDVHLGPTAAFAVAMDDIGLDYPEMWTKLIELAA